MKTSFGNPSIPDADEARGAAGQALESTRQFTGQAMEKAGEKMRELGSGMKDLAGKGMTSVGQATAAAQRKLGSYAQATGRYISDEPVKAALIAAALGAAVAALVLAMRRDKHR